MTPASGVGLAASRYGPCGVTPQVTTRVRATPSVGVHAHLPTPAENEKLQKRSCSARALDRTGNDCRLDGELVTFIGS